MKNKFYEKIIILSWIIFLFICLGLLSFTSHAASDQDYFPIEQNKNGHFTDNDISLISNYFDDENNYIVVYYFDYNYRAIVFPKSTYTNNLGQLCGEKNSALTHFSFYGLGIIPTTTYQFQIMFGNQIVNLQNFGSGFNYWQNLPSSNYDTSKDYISNLRIWTTNNSSKKLVINYEEEPTYTDPDNDTYPNNFDKPSFSDYVDYGSAPSFDSSSLESMVESLYNLLKWNFNTLIPGVVNYIIDGLNWALQKVINNIRNVIKELQEVVEDFSETVSGYLSDIKDSFDYLTEPVDPEVLYDTYSGTAMASDIGSIQTNFTSFVTQFNDIAEPNTYKIPVHFENITLFHDVGVQYIDLGWIDPVKSVLRAFLWCITTYGLIAAIFDAIPKYINGGGDEGD